MSKFKTGITAASIGILAVAIVIIVNRNGDAMTAAGEHGCTLDKSSLGEFVDIKGGGFIKGADPKYLEEGPPEKIFVSPFRLQAHEVTNRQFAAFVAATGYVTKAERNGGSAQFSKSTTPANLSSWWTFDQSATWRTPQGTGSNLDGLDLHPVVHVTLNDARAYAKWAGGRIPTEVEWEYAASLGLFDPGDLNSGYVGPDGEARANIWTGLFPVMDSGRDGFAGLAPVGCYEASRIGAYDMVGNVWEWTNTPFSSGTPRYTIKGGSYLCSDNYCQRYRAAARQEMETDFSTAHIGFRIVQNMEYSDVD